MHETPNARLAEIHEALESARKLTPADAWQRLYKQDVAALLDLLDVAAGDVRERDAQIASLKRDMAAATSPPSAPERGPAPAAPVPTATPSAVSNGHASGGRN